MRNLKKEDKLYIQTFREIRRYIIENDLKPGDLLPTEQAMCQSLGVSRNVLREAIKSMELMGMVSACPGKGTVIKEFSLNFIFQNVLFFNVSDEDARVREMFDIRRMLEMGYMRKAFQALDDDDIKKLRQCADRIRDGWENSRLFAEADRDFHMTLFKPLGNSVLNSLLEAIWEVDQGFQLEKKSPHLATSVTKHEAIVDALEKYDYRAFARAMEAHFSSGKYTMAGSYEEF
ncbi:MAG: FadR/GntR family transcriptional regulator [Clostridia bacterium]|nr:FadR/GntR family transcriptional regulator [Clostridia bacterium]